MSAARKIPTGQRSCGVGAVSCFLRTQFELKSLSGRLFLVRGLFPLEFVTAVYVFREERIWTAFSLLQTQIQSKVPALTVNSCDGRQQEIKITNLTEETAIQVKIPHLQTEVRRRAGACGSAVHKNKNARNSSRFVFSRQCFRPKGNSARCIRCQQACNFCSCLACCCVRTS